MKIVWVSDLHLPAPGEMLWSLDAYGRVQSCLDDIATHHGDADLCVITGDLADAGDPGAYRWLTERLADFPLETVLLIGNHDDRAAMRAHLPNLPDDGNGFVQSVRDTDQGRMLFLDTFKGGTSAGQYCAARRDWLRQRLEEAGDNPVWLFMHHPPFDVGIDYMDRIKLEEHAEFAGIVNGRNVRHLFFGHIHRACQVVWQGIPCASLPSTNHQVPLSREGLGSRYSIEPPMYGVILIHGDQTIVHMDAWADRAQAPTGA